MSYQYLATDEELKAAQLLKERGWKLTEPSCPDCGGSGYIRPYDALWNPDLAGREWPRCPRECEAPMWFF